MKKLILLLIPFIMGLHSVPLSGQTTGAVRGHVKNSQTDDPISNAKIQLIPEMSGYLTYDFYSDNKGLFYRGGIRPGTYKVLVEKDGYLPVSSSIRIRLADTANIEITLDPVESVIPESTHAIVKGSKLLDTGHYEKAAAIFDEAISSDPSNPVLFYYRGAASERIGNIEMAIEGYQRAVDLKPDFVLPMSRIGILSARKGDMNKAIEFFGKAVEMGDQDTNTYYNYGVSLLNVGKHEVAKDIFSKLISFDEDFPDAYYQLGIINISLGNIEKAKGFLHTFLEMDPKNVNADIAKQILKSLDHLQ